MLDQFLHTNDISIQTERVIIKFKFRRNENFYIRIDLDSNIHIILG